MDYMELMSAVLKKAIELNHSPTPPQSTKRPKESWGHLNKKDGLTRYGDSHVKDKTS